MILEIGKSYINRFYNGNLEEAIKNKDGILWTDERIKKTFNYGNGTPKHFKNYIESNKKNCYFVEV